MHPWKADRVKRSAIAKDIYNSQRKSKYTGVTKTFNPISLLTTWQARYKKHIIGEYKSERVAAIAYDMYTKRILGDDYRGNILPPIS